jgi:hypothetical protein
MGFIAFKTGPCINIILEPKPKPTEVVPLRTEEEKSTLPLSTMAKVNFSSLHQKTGHNSSGGFLFFSFIFISAKSLKNHSKLQKNHKIKNLILLDST